jgi:hypothetical protein
MARRTKLRVTNPEFLQYANLKPAFAVSNPAHHGVAWRLVATLFPGIDWRCHYTPETVCRELNAHLPTFRAVLDGLIARDLTPALEATIAEHVGHFGPHPQVDRSPPRSFLDPEREVDIEAYGLIFKPIDPLDPLYYQLHRFLLTRHVQDLGRCPTCGRYFFALTARLKTYCSDPCRGGADPRGSQAEGRAEVAGGGDGAGPGGGPGGRAASARARRPRLRVRRGLGAVPRAARARGNGQTTHRPPYLQAAPERGAWRRARGLSHRPWRGAPADDGAGRGRTRGCTATVAMPLGVPPRRVRRSGEPCRRPQ